MLKFRERHAVNCFLIFYESAIVLNIDLLCLYCAVPLASYIFYAK